ncbi:MAG TPA: aminotransferase class III-fold pyridoxal phosphate-dependent enzyme, partial [Candidatus Binatia bacterium]
DQWSRLLAQHIGKHIPGKPDLVVQNMPGAGHMIAANYVYSKSKPDGKLRDRVMQKSYEKGLLLLSCGESTLRFCPPLIVTPEHIATAVEIFESAVVAAA